MKLARILFAILAIAALGVGCSDMPTEAGGCPVSGGPHCVPGGDGLDTRRSSCSRGSRLTHSGAPALL